MLRGHWQSLALDQVDPNRHARIRSLCKLAFHLNLTVKHRKRLSFHTQSRVYEYISAMKTVLLPDDSAVPTPASGPRRKSIQVGF